MPWHKKVPLYEQQILKILLDVGARGISVKKLAKHVYNHFCTLFFQPDFAEVYRYVQQYLQSHSRSENDIVEHAEKWGHYRLNTRNSREAQQLMLDFREDEEENSENGNPVKDLSLSLFD